MVRLKRFGVSMERSLLGSFDRLLKKKGYTNRSEAIRGLVRRWLVEDEWSKGKGKVGVLLIVYDHRKRDLSARILEKSHHHHHLIISTLHVHLDENSCLEVNILKGRPKEMERLAEQLIATKGVKFGQFIPAASGKGL